MPDTPDLKPIIPLRALFEHRTKRRILYGTDPQEREDAILIFQRALPAMSKTATLALFLCELGFYQDQAAKILSKPKRWVGQQFSGAMDVLLWTCTGNALWSTDIEWRRVQSLGELYGGREKSQDRDQAASDLEQVLPSWTARQVQTYMLRVAGFTQEECAEIVGVSQGAISQRENRALAHHADRATAREKSTHAGEGAKRAIEGEKHSSLPPKPNTDASGSVLRDEDRRSVQAHCCVCDKRLTGTAWLCGDCYKEYAPGKSVRGWPAWLRRAKQEEQNRRRLERRTRDISLADQE